MSAPVEVRVRCPRRHDLPVTLSAECRACGGQTSTPGELTTTLSDPMATLRALLTARLGEFNNGHVFFVALGEDGKGPLARVSKAYFIDLIAPLPDPAALRSWDAAIEGGRSDG